MCNARPCWLVGVVILASFGWAADEAPQPIKTGSVLYPSFLIEHARANAAAFDWARDMRDGVVASAAPWVNLSDEALWAMPFGPNINRSWMVWSDGYCPACKKDVKMYTWEMDPWTIPWKVRCPHCKELFPKNDFEAFHRSGYDEHGVFQPELADRSLLFNTEHPDPADPLHGFGVDDGEGYVGDGHRWRFIGCYLIYGHWKALIHRGIVNLSEAYMATGDSRYAYKAAILLDRVADLYPSFDFGKQGWVYETQQGTRGQISTWHDACEETRELAEAFDRIFEAARREGPALAAFLSGKAREFKLENPKATWADIQRNIEQGILVDTLNHRERIESNYPRTDVALLTIKTVLSWPENREEVMGLLDGVIVEATAVDGVSGEKGMAGYTTIAPRALAGILGLFSRLEPGFLRTVYERYPVLRDTYRFHIDLKCLDEYYPQSGDSGAFGMKSLEYAGVALGASPGTEPSMYAFMMDLYEITGDPAFVQTLYRANGSKVDGLPHALLAEDPAAFQARVQAVIDEHGEDIKLGSVNKENWRIAVLRSGEGENRRALWLDYDSGGRHSHHDALNMGYFAKGLDLAPDFGYPPVGYGGWGAPKAVWYTMSAAHVTVVVDGENHRNASGRTMLWVDGEAVRAISAEAKEAIGGDRFERTLVMVDVDEKDAYVVDCFRVRGGKDHAKFFHSLFGKVETDGLEFAPGEDYGHGTEMRNFITAPGAKAGWRADWLIEDHYGYLPEGKQVRLRYTDMTSAAEVSLAEAWVETNQFGGAPAWIPRLVIRRRTASDYLDSTFISVFAAYEQEPPFLRVHRLELETLNGRPLGDAEVALDVVRRDGRRDLIILPNGFGASEMIAPQVWLHFRGRMAAATVSGERVERLALYETEWMKLGATEVNLSAGTAYVEIVFGDDGARVVAGDPASITKLTVGGRAVPLRGE